MMQIEEAERAIKKGKPDEFVPLEKVKHNIYVVLYLKYFKKRKV